MDTAPDSDGRDRVVIDRRPDPPPQSAPTGSAVGAESRACSYSPPSLTVYGGVQRLTDAVGRKGRKDMSGSRKTGF